MESTDALSNITDLYTLESIVIDSFTATEVHEHRFSHHHLRHGVLSCLDDDANVSSATTPFGMASSVVWMMMSTCLDVVQPHLPKSASSIIHLYCALHRFI